MYSNPTCLSISLLPFHFSDFSYPKNMEYSQVFDIVKFEKEKAIAIFNLFQKLSKFRQILEAALLLVLISWSSARAPAAARTAADSALRFSAYLLNHHVVFLIGNAIIVLLFVLCRRNDDVASSADGGAGIDLYDDYVKHREAASPTPPPQAPPPDEKKQIVVRAEETETAKCDDVAAAIEKATRQIKRFERTQSEKLRREIGARPQSELRRSESQNRRRSVSSGEQVRGSVDMERLSSEEFRRTVDAFIDKHWGKKEKIHNGFEEYELLKMV